MCARENSDIRPCILVGDAPYYERFGFSRAGAEQLDLPGPVDLARFLALELQPGALDGASGLVRATGAFVASAKATPPGGLIFRSLIATGRDQDILAQLRRVAPDLRSAPSSNRHIRRQNAHGAGGVA